MGCICSTLKTAETSGVGVCSVLGILSYQKIIVTKYIVELKKAI